MVIPGIRVGGPAAERDELGRKSHASHRGHAEVEASRGEQALTTPSCPLRYLRPMRRSALAWPTTGSTAGAASHLAAERLGDAAHLTASTALANSATTGSLITLVAVRGDPGFHDLPLLAPRIERADLIRSYETANHAACTRGPHWRAAIAGAFCRARGTAAVNVRQLGRSVG